MSLESLLLSEIQFCSTIVSLGRARTHSDDQMEAILDTALEYWIMRHKVNAHDNFSHSKYRYDSSFKMVLRNLKGMQESLVWDQKKGWCCDCLDKD